MLARTAAKVIDVTPAFDTNAYASGDRMGNIFEIPEAVLNEGGTALLISLMVIDKDNKGTAFDVLVFSEEPTVASADNAAINIADAELDKLLGEIVVEAADYKALAANQYAMKRDFALPVHCKTTTNPSNKAEGRKLWGMCVCRENVTRTASGMTLRFGLAQD